MNAATTPWPAALFGRAAERAWCAIDALALRLADAPPPAGRGSLASGDAGVALFFSYLHRARPGRGFDAQAQARLDRAAAWLAAEPVSAHLHTGAAGVAWALAHAAGDANAGGTDDDDGLAEVDALVERHVDLRPDDAPDFVGGLAGLAFYALSRLPRAAARRALETAVARFDATAEPAGDGLCWPVRGARGEAPPTYPEGSVDLGVAHGLPGVLAVLAQLAARGVAAGDARRLAEGAVEFLRGRLREAGRNALPDVLVPGRPARAARAAWCYGDPGLAAAWHTAALALDRPDWQCEAAAVACRAARRPPAGSGVRDASLCHGAAGLGLAFQRLACVSADGDLARAASDWHTLALHAPPADDQSLLTGGAGVGLALLAAVSRVEPAWDSLLLFSPARAAPAAP